MMRIAYICADPAVPVFGAKSSSVQVQEMLRAFVQQGADVQLFAARIGGTVPRGLEHVRVHTLSPLPKAEAAERERAALRGNQELRWLLADAGPFNVIYERYSLWSYAGMEAAAAAGLAGLLEVNAPLIEEQIEYSVLVDRDAAEQVARRAFRAAGAVIAASHSLVEHLHRRYGDVCGDVIVTPAGVDPARFPARPQPFALRRANAFTIGFIGTLQPWHGLPVLLDAFAQLTPTLPHARLLVVGEGLERAALLADVERRGLRHAVDVISAVAPDEVPELLGRMDVAVAPHDLRADFHPAPVKIFECMAAGVPVVASRIGNHGELIDHGSTGLLCEPGDAAGIAHALELLACNPLLRARLSADGREHVLSQHTWDAIARRALDLVAALSARPAA